MTLWRKALSWLHSRSQGLFAPKADSAAWSFDPPLQASANAPAPAASKTWKRWRLARLILPFGFLVLLLYYVLGAILLEKIDTQPGFRPSALDLPPRGSVALGMAAGLLDRELNQNGWKPNNPFFFPSAFMDNMPNFQLGLLTTLRPFVLEVKDYGARLRGSGATDADLDNAFAALSYPADIWLLGERWPYIGASSESFYRDGLQHLRAYNQRLSTGQALYERRTDALVAILNRMSLSLGDASARTERAVEDPDRGGLFDTKADDIFYDNKGQAYAAYLLLIGLREDYADTLRQRQLNNLWAAMLDSLRQMIVMNPLIVSNGDPDALFSANHLTTQNTYLLTARNRLREISNVLQQ
jgi:hypothetical protein